MKELILPQITCICIWLSRPLCSYFCLPSLILTVFCRVPRSSRGESLPCSSPSLCFCLSPSSTSALPSRSDSFPESRPIPASPRHRGQHPPRLSEAPLCDITVLMSFYRKLCFCLPPCATRSMNPMNLFWGNVKKLVIRITQRKRITSKPQRQKVPLTVSPSLFKRALKSLLQANRDAAQAVWVVEGRCRSLFRLLRPSTTGWVACEQCRFIFHIFRGCESLRSSRQPDWVPGRASFLRPHLRGGGGG